MPGKQTQKVTAHIPVDLLQEAQAMTGKSIAETLKIVYEALRKMRGKVKFSIDVDNLRKDK